MNDERPQLDLPVVLHTEVAVALLIAGVLVVAGLITTVWTENWAYALTFAIVAFGVLFVAACIPQIRAARELRRTQQAPK